MTEKLEELKELISKCSLSATGKELIVTGLPDDIHRLFLILSHLDGVVNQWRKEAYQIGGKAAEFAGPRE